MITVLKICKSLWMLFSGVVSFWFKQTIERLVQYIMDKVCLFLRCVLMTWANLRDVFSIEFMIVMFVDVITSLKNKFLFNNAKFSFMFKRGLSWSYGGWIYNYLCNQCLSPLKLRVRSWLVSDLQQVSCFLRVLLFPPPIKLTTTM